MGEAMRDALIGKVAKFWRRPDSGGWPFYVILLDYQEGFFHVRSLDRKDELESIESRERWWIPALAPATIEIMTEAMIREDAERMLPRDEWGPIVLSPTRVRKVWLVRVAPWRGPGNHGWVDRTALDEPKYFHDYEVTGNVERAKTFASEREAAEFAGQIRGLPFQFEVVPWEILPA